MSNNNNTSEIHEVQGANSVLGTLFRASIKDHLMVASSTFGAAVLGFGLGKPYRKGSAALFSIIAFVGTECIAYQNVCKRRGLFDSGLNKYSKQ